MSERDITLAASKFKATCLDVLKQLESGKLKSVTITRRGKPVAKVQASVAAGKNAFDELWGCMAGTVTFIPGVDLTAPLEDIPEPIDPFFGHSRDDDAP